MPRLFHRSAEVAAILQLAVGNDALVADADTPAAHRGITDNNMAGFQTALGAAEKSDKSIARLGAAGLRTGMPWPARTIHFTRCDARKPDTLAFIAMYGAIAVPHGNWSAEEQYAGS